MGKSSDWSPLPPGGEGVGGWGDLSASAKFRNSARATSPPTPTPPHKGEGLFLRLWCCFISAALAMTTPAQAHRMNTAMTLIEVSATGGRLEVTHTLYAHDMEDALRAGAVPLSWFETREGKNAIRDYCLAQFTLNDARGRPIALTFVGLELRGDAIDIYFDAPRYRGTSVIVDSNFLQETSDSQINRVNVRARGRTVSAVFQVGAGSQQIAMP